MCQVTEPQITRVATALSVGASIEDIHDLLIQDGMSEYEVFLTYHAAQLLLNHQD